MKKVQMKRSGIGYARPKDLKKPFDFCCDINNQDPETQYDMRIPPIETSLTNLVPNNDGPDLKFRIQDISKALHPTSVIRSGAHKVKSSTNFGKCKRCRGPLRWYIEDEVALARDIIAREKEIKYEEERKARIALNRTKRKKSKKRKEQIIVMNEAKENEEEKEDSEVEDEDLK